MKESRFIKTKIVAGYVLLAVVCIVPMGYVYRTIGRISVSDVPYERMQEKRDRIDRTLYHLYRAESYAQMLIAGADASGSRYARELDEVKGCIDSLRARTDDSLQLLRLDSIVSLLDDKRRRTMRLYRSIGASDAELVIDRNIRSLTDSAAAAGPVEPQGMILQDTVVVPRKKRRFFRRLADLFSPPKADSDLIVSRQEIHGTASPGVVRDSIANVLRALQDSVQTEHRARRDAASREGLRLHSGTEQINDKIYRLLQDFDEEETGMQMERIAEAERMRRRSSHVLGAIAGAALLLVLLFVSILWRDINRGNRYRRALEQANREKELLLAAREKLMLAITHDIKAPLGSVLGYVDLLSRLDPGPREQQYIGHIRSSAEHLLALVGSLLDFYRLDMNKVEPHAVTFSPARLFETMLHGFAAQAAARGIELRQQIAAGASAEVSGDALRIRQIAENLISNALKFTDRGSVALSVAVADGVLTFEVADTGRGMSEQERAGIFGAFVRAGSARGVEGFGLGLSIVDRLVRLLRGTISVESEPGRGSRFCVSLPVGEAADEAASGGGEELHVLLVDDDALQLQLAAAICRESGIVSECCPYPEYAARIVGERRFDAVLTDMQMPAADGCAVLEAIRRVDATIPVIAVSARDRIDAQGFAAFLRKPFSGSELTAVIRSVCGGPEPVAEVHSADGAPAAAPEEDAIRLEALTAYAEGDRAAADEILRSFVAQNTEACRQIEQALADGATDRLRAVAHRMRPVFTLIGAARVAAVLRRAEEHEAMTEALRRALEEAVRTIREIVRNVEKELER